MQWPNGRIDANSPYRFGSAARNELYVNTNSNRLNRFYTSQWSKKVGGSPSGYGMKGTVPVYTIGALSVRNGYQILTNNAASVSIGTAASGSTTMTLTNNNADLSLIVLVVGSATLALAVNNATLQLVANMVGSTTGTITVNDALLNAIIELFGTSSQQLSTAAILTANGELAGDILPYTELSPENLAIAVWNAIATEYTASGTMGELLNTAGSGGLPPELQAKIMGSLQKKEFLALK
jgi:hypothetical protein